MDQLSQPVLTESALAATEELARSSKPVETNGIWTAIVSALAKFDSWFSGPAMTEQDRIHRDVAEAAVDRRVRSILL